MNRLETSELEHVLTLAEELSFTAAADRLDIAQPALSRAIARTERRLGVALFVRTTRSVQLTAAGERFVARAQSVLGDLDELVRAAREGERGRPLVVALRPGAGSGLLGSALDTWSGAPVQVELTRDPLGAVRGGLADLAIACTTDHLAQLRVDELASEPTVALVRKGHPLSRFQHLTLERVTTSEGFQQRCPDLALDEIADKVAFGGLVVLVAADAGGAAQRLSSRVRAVPVADAPATVLCSAYRTGVSHRSAAAFVRQLRAARGPASA